MSSRATQIRQKRTLVLLAVSHRALAEANQEARRICRTTFERPPLVLGGWEEAMLAVYRALEAPLETEQEVDRARPA
jgi:hypothetical protein